MTWLKLYVAPGRVLGATLFLEDFRAASLPLSIRNDSSISVKSAGATQWLRSHSVIIQPLTRCLPRDSLVYTMPVR